MPESRRFPPPWTVERSHKDAFTVKDANGLALATVHCRDDLQKWSFGHTKLTSSEARKIAKAIHIVCGTTPCLPDSSADTQIRLQTARSACVLSGLQGEGNGKTIKEGD
jgi:hypothetical protein